MLDLGRNSVKANNDTIIFCPFEESESIPSRSVVRAARIEKDSLTITKLYRTVSCVGCFRKDAITTKMQSKAKSYDDWTGRF